MICCRLTRREGDATLDIRNPASWRYHDLALSHAGDGIQFEVFVIFCAKTEPFLFLFCTTVACRGKMERICPVSFSPGMLRLRRYEVCVFCRPIPLREPFKRKRFPDKCTDRSFLTIPAITPTLLLEETHLTAGVAKRFSCRFRIRFTVKTCCFTETVGKF